ncbi:MAG: hypothetical protein RIT81_39580 [Deltaproteobacteria bacterium]
MNLRTPTLVLIAGAVSACATTGPISDVRFEDRPIVWKVTDDAHVEERPEITSFQRAHHVFDSIIAEPIDRALAAPPVMRAKNVNAIGGVPDSSWFENRFLTPEEVLRGPGREVDAPTPPFVVKSAKQGGMSVGFIVEDARGLKFILKFDDAAHPEMKSAANIVAQRLFYALGYHVPEDHIAYFSPDELRISEEVELMLNGARLKLDRELLDELLADVGRDEAGIRGLFSRFLEGEPIGGWTAEGRRADDPNDIIEHQHRRELRGLHMFAAWLEHTDFKKDNRLDVFVSRGERSFVQHYLVDFDKTLGVNATLHPRAVDGFAVAWDVGYALATLPTFGLWTRPWERIAPVHGMRGIARFQSEVFLPDEWVPKYPQPVFRERTRYDELWAASVLAKVTPAHIEAAVRAAQYTDPKAEAYMVRTLVERRRTLLELGFSGVTPLDRFRVEPRRFCFVDAWIEHGFAAPESTAYEIIAFTSEGRPLDAYTIAASSSGVACVDDFLSTVDPYVILKIATERDGAELEPVEVHLGRGLEGRRIVGVVRAEESS